MSAITAKASRKMKKYAVLTREPRCFLGSFDFSWEQRKFSDVVATRRGLTYKPSDIRKNGVRVLRSSNIAEDSFVLSDEDVFVVREAVNIDCVRANDILITAANGSSRLVGKHTIISGIPEESAVHGGFMLLGTTKEPHFVNASMGSSWYRRFIELFVAGGNGAIGNLNKNDLDNQDIAIPSEKEQKKIGSFFRQLDNLITLHQRKCVFLFGFFQAFISMIFTASTFSWEQRKVGDFYDFKNGLNKGKAFFGKGTPIVNFTDVFHKRGITTQMLRGRVTLTPSEISNYGVKQGDIFVTRTSETIEEIGYASVMLDSPKDTVFSGFVLRGRAIKEDPLTLKFKQFVFSTDAFRSEMIKKSSMTTRALTSGTAIKKMYFQYPVSTEEQNRIGQFLESLDHLITLHQRECISFTARAGRRILTANKKRNTSSWEQRKFEDIAVRSSIISSESGLPRVEYEDIISGTGCLNKDIFNKESDKTGIVFHKGDVLYGKLRPYLQNWLLPLFDGLAVGDFLSLIHI